MKKRIITAILAALMLAASLAACSGNQTAQTEQNTTASQAAVQTQSSTAVSSDQNAATAASISSSDSSDLSFTGYAGGVLNTTDLFSSRDLTQTADTSNAKQITVTDGQNQTITEDGVYILSGTASNATVIVEAADDAKVQLVLSNLSITNSSAPAIYVKNADKVFVTTAEGSQNSLSVSGAFTADGDTNTDAVIFSKDDLVFNGKGSLSISSSDNGISGKDDIKITGGTISITSASDAIEANESIVIADGTITISTDKDGLHAENDEDTSTGYIYIGGGTLNIDAASDGVQATSVLQIDGGAVTANASEGLEGTYVQINGGSINITASDDGINASNKSSAYSVTGEFNGGEITISMGQGDTDAIDVNGNLYVRGGTFNITGQSAFDYDGQCEYTGGTIYVNGELVTDITNQFGGMGGPGGMGGRGGMNPPGM